MNIFQLPFKANHLYVFHTPLRRNKLLSVYKFPNQPNKYWHTTHDTLTNGLIQAMLNHMDNFESSADTLETRLILNDHSLEVEMIYHEDLTILRNKFKLGDMVGMDPILIEDIPTEYRKFCVFDFST